MYSLISIFFLQIYETKGLFLFFIGSGYTWSSISFFSQMVESFILIDFCYYYIKSFMQGQLLSKMPV
ncbi:putative ER lumen protein retaining receptor [Lupinus albus]|uniref:Putative ER lumen protein retaining receptor n=1 Tax=Lupinus albus TaxID=3870 RepID=A0A6A4PPF6_LUPAL|nr:putative ER lumen protein retaining receptor [Lupinus albus]